VGGGSGWSPLQSRGGGGPDRGAFLFRLARNLFHLSSIRIFSFFHPDFLAAGFSVFQAKSLNLLARPTGIEPVFPP
jgi:hypothetical protein